MANKPLIIQGPQACGKTLNSVLFAKFFNKKNIVDGIPAHSLAFKNLEENDIAFCYETPSVELRERCTVLRFEDAVSLLEAQGLKIVNPKELQE